MCVVSFILIVFLDRTQTYNDNMYRGHILVYIFHQPIGDEHTKLFVI